MTVETIYDGSRIVISDSEQSREPVVIERTVQEKTVVLKIHGAVKTRIGNAFSDILMRELKACGRLVLDFSKVLYIASSGLRALLNAQQYIDEADDAPEMILCGINDEVRGVFESTGFDRILDIRD